MEVRMIGSPTRHPRIRLDSGDIARLPVDAIVNAANSSLLGGGGVDGAIHRAAGPELLAECRTLGGCPPGEARLTGGYRLPAKYVIHTVGPVWRGGSGGEAETLANCYRACLAIARDEAMSTVAFPAISTGIYGFPREPAGRIAVDTVARHLASETAPQTVIFVCFDAATCATYDAALATA
jgi:O-acetyl-ADP-ribose deacetylase